jgi:hypothetical protein
MSAINGLGRLGASLPTSIGVGSLPKAVPKLPPSLTPSAGSALGGLSSSPRPLPTPPTATNRVGAAQLPPSIGAGRLPPSPSFGSNFATGILGGAAPTASGIGSKVLDALPTAAPILGTAATVGQDALGVASMAASTGSQIATQLAAAKLNEQLDLTQALTSLMNKGSSGIAKAAGGQ